ncbi:MAG: NusG domain II-containing protein [Gammaproteobacteria bacterium]
MLILLVAAGLVGASFSAFWGPRGQGEMAVITVNRQPALELMLDQDRTIEIPGRIGTSTIMIDGGRVRFLDSPCPARYCVHSGWLQRSGEVAACLPNGVVVEVLGGEREFDAINL